MYLIQHYLDIAADKKPNKIAIVYNDKDISYLKLQEKSNKLANALIKKGVKRNSRILVLLNRNIDTIVAFLGIVKADAVYVPIDTTMPKHRLRKIIEDCRPAAVVCDNDTILKINKTILNEKYLITILMSEITDNIAHLVGFIDITKDEIEKSSKIKPEYKNIDADIAYILYTSGSSGTPKGVIISHINIINYIEWAVGYLEINSEDRILSTAPFHFDMSTFDIYASIKSCATLVIVNEKVLLFPNIILDIIEKNKITIWKAISSLLTYFVKTKAIEKGRIPTLKKLIFAGETLPTKSLIKWMEAFPEKLFFNAYGPTEATGIATCYFVKNLPTNSKERIPIGKACKNAEVFIINEDDMECKVNEIGEICIRGSCLSAGYWNDAERTKRSFTINPLQKDFDEKIFRTKDIGKYREDREIEYIGRKDYQVKYMGYRIELFDIENSMREIKGVYDAAAILTSNEYIDAEEIIGFCETEKKINMIDIQDKLLDYLPKYMIPKKIYKISDLPRTSRGKIDRTALHDFHLDQIQNK